MSEHPPGYWILYGAGILAGALTVGIVVGLLPFFLARRHGQRKTAWFGFIACIVASLIAGIIAAAPTALAFVIAILIRRPKAAAIEQVLVSRTPVPVNDAEQAGSAAAARE